MKKNWKRRRHILRYECFCPILWYVCSDLFSSGVRRWTDFGSWRSCILWVEAKNEGISCDCDHARQLAANNSINFECRKSRLSFLLISQTASLCRWEAIPLWPVWERVCKEGCSENPQDLRAFRTEVLPLCRLWGCIQSQFCSDRSQEEGSHANQTPSVSKTHYLGT